MWISWSGWRGIFQLSHMGRKKKLPIYIFRSLVFKLFPKSRVALKWNSRNYRRRWNVTKSWGSSLPSSEQPYFFCMGQRSPVRNVISRKNLVPSKQGWKVLFEIGDCEMFLWLHKIHMEKGFSYTEHRLSAQEILNHKSGKNLGICILRGVRVTWSQSQDQVSYSSR